MPAPRVRSTPAPATSAAIPWTTSRPSPRPPTRAPTRRSPRPPAARGPGRRAAARGRRRRRPRRCARRSSSCRAARPTAAGGPTSRPARWVEWKQRSGAWVGRCSTARPVPPVLRVLPTLPRLHPTPPHFSTPPGPQDILAYRAPLPQLPAAPAARLTEQLVSPLNAAYEAARGAMGQAPLADADALTIATVNRYTYGLGEVGVGGGGSWEVGETSQVVGALTGQPAAVWHPRSSRAQAALKPRAPPPPRRRRSAWRARARRRRRAAAPRATA
jgi:hypothetical protein